MIADQTVTGYIQGIYTEDDLQKSLRYYSDTLNASIWVTDEKGIIYGFANAKGHPDNPKNIFLINPDFDIDTAQSFNGSFLIPLMEMLSRLRFQSGRTTSQTACC